jgi:hypothetical protein
MLAAFLVFFQKFVFIHEIDGIFWFSIKTKNFCVHKEYSSLAEGSAEFKKIALQAFCAESEANILVVENKTSRIILATSLANLKLSGNRNKSSTGYSLRYFCKDTYQFDQWQNDLEVFGKAKKNLEMVTPDGKPCSEKNVYGELIPDTDFYFCRTEPAHLIF